MTKKILIVEDNKDSREILGLFITKIGHQVIKACNSKEAIICAEAEGPDLIFMDMGLPDVDGVKTTANLKQNPKTSRIPVVALTAWVSELWREKALKGMPALLPLFVAGCPAQFSEPRGRAPAPVLHAPGGQNLPPVKMGNVSERNRNPV